MQVALVSPVSPFLSAPPGAAAAPAPQARPGAFDQVMRRSATGQTGEDAASSRAAPEEDLPAPDAGDSAVPNADNPGADDPSPSDEPAEAAPLPCDTSVDPGVLVPLPLLLPPLPFFLADPAVPQAAISAAPAESDLLQSVALAEPPTEAAATDPTPAHQRLQESGDVPGAMPTAAGASEAAPAPQTVAVPRPSLNPSASTSLPPVQGQEVAAAAPQQAALSAQEPLRRLGHGPAHAPAVVLPLHGPAQHPAAAPAVDRAGRIPPAFAARLVMQQAAAEEAWAQQPGMTATPSSAAPVAPAPPDRPAPALSLSDAAPIPAPTAAPEDAMPTDIPGDIPEHSAGQAAAAPSLPGGTVPVRHAHGPALPPTLGIQLSAVLAQGKDGPVELTLSPEELGRLRMTLSRHGEALQVMVQVERIDTLDLLRRNSDLLLQEIRLAGFSGATFAFSGWGGDRADSPLPQTNPATMPPPDASVPLAAQGAPAGLDLRL